MTVRPVLSLTSVVSGKVASSAALSGSTARAVAAPNVGEVVATSKSVKAAQPTEANDPRRIGAERQGHGLPR